MNADALQPLLLKSALTEQVVSPYASEKITLTEAAYGELKWQVGYWKSNHARASAQVKALRQELKQQEARFRLRLQEAKCAREVALQEVIKQKEAMIRDLTHRLYGKGSEKNGKLQGQSNTEKASVVFGVKRARGQQKGSKGHGRTDHSDMPTVDEAILLSESVCPQCKKPYTFLADETSQRIEIQVRAYKRMIRRERCVKNCTCTPGSELLTAPLPPSLLSKSPYGLSVWEEVLLQKFLYAATQPSYFASL